MTAYWRGCLFLIALVLAPIAAFGQGVPINAGAVTPGHAPMYVGPPTVGPGSQVVIGDSGPAGGGANGLGLGELLLVARGNGSTTTAPYGGQGTGPYGTNLCDYDAPTNNPTGYHYLCFSANAQGGALIAVGSGGIASNQPLNIIVNGISYPFPGSLSTITIGTTPIIGGSNGACLYVNGSVVGQLSCTVSSITQLTGDVTAVGPGSAAATLATVNSNIGSFGSSSQIPVVTVNGKGLVTAASVVTVGLNIGTTSIIGGTGSYLLFNNGGTLGNETIASILTAGTGISITGTTQATIACSLGTSAAAGCLRGDGSTVTISTGILSCTTATSSQIGCVEPDGTIITVSGGFITVASATGSTFGVIKGDNSTITLTAGVASCTTATASQLGCAKPDGSTITASAGVLTSHATASSITVGSTGVNSGTSNYLLSSNGGTLSNVSINSITPGGNLNRFRNVSFDIWQRGTSLSIGTTGNYGPDGWKIGFTGSTSVTAARTLSGVSGYPEYALSIVGASSNSDVSATQRIESTVAAPLAGQTVTVQFQYTQNTGSSVTPKISTCYASAADNFATCTSDLAATSLTSCPTATWCSEAYTFTASANAVNGYSVTIDCNAAFTSGSLSCILAAPDIRVTPGVTTGINSSPPPPELRPVALEQTVSYRYYYQPPAAWIYQNQGSSIAMVITTDNTFPVPFRTTPTCSISFTAANISPSPPTQTQLTSANVAYTATTTAATQGTWSSQSTSNCSAEL